MLTSTITAKAYDNDTHFWLTYYLAVKAGYTNIQATQIASANVSVDFDRDTEPVLPRIGLTEVARYKAVHNVVRSDFHALPFKTEVNKITGEPFYWWDPSQEVRPHVQRAMEALVRKRRLEFWFKTLMDSENPGPFLHYLQDSFAHENFASFIGHAGYSRIDFLASDKGKTRRMADATLRYLIAFREVFEGKQSPESVINPNTVSLQNYFGSDELAEIWNAVGSIRDINPSDGVQPNRVVTIWNTSLSEKSKKKYTVPSNDLLLALRETSKTNPAPDSRRTRDLMKDVLRVTEINLPVIWLYDYKRRGSVKRYTKVALRYSSIPPTMAFAYFTSIDEANNFEKSKNHLNRVCSFALTRSATGGAECRLD